MDVSQVIIVRNSWQRLFFKKTIFLQKFILELSNCTDKVLASPVFSKTKLLQEQFSKIWQLISSVKWNKYLVNWTYSCKYTCSSEHFSADGFVIKICFSSKQPVKFSTNKGLPDHAIKTFLKNPCAWARFSKVLVTKAVPLLKILYILSWALCFWSQY